ncbi:MAG: hypothetical protein H6657_00545 [Ardenticatenaceae bacterium]|nr:hypothetical protein [Anaerolineales bacterium]MCB8975900.1 hypothetical protein [Ardenticatenaceae bacterium]
MLIIMAETAVFGEWVVSFSQGETAVCHFNRPHSQKYHESRSKPGSGREK